MLLSCMLGVLCATVFAQSRDELPPDMDEERIEEIYSRWRWHKARAEATGEISLGEARQKAAREAGLPVEQFDAVIRYHEAHREQQYQDRQTLERNKSRLFWVLLFANIPVYVLFAWALGVFSPTWFVDMKAYGWSSWKKGTAGYQWAALRFVYLLIACGTVLYLQFQFFLSWLV